MGRETLPSGGRSQRELISIALSKHKRPSPTTKLPPPTLGAPHERHYHHLRLRPDEKDSTTHHGIAGTAGGSSSGSGDGCSVLPTTAAKREETLDW
jgi:hypothetical protein